MRRSGAPRLSQNGRGGVKKNAWIIFGHVPTSVVRIVVVSSVGDRVYSDEQSEFKCNTLQVKQH